MDTDGESTAMVDGPTELPRGEDGMPLRREATILCCLCGVHIPPNPANMCVACLRSQVDITEGIPRSLTVQQCRQCNRWHRPPFQHAELESPELLSILLKKIPGLSRSHGATLVDAGFVWTEPHSKRIKVKLTLQKDTDFRVRLQQSMVVEFSITNQQCTDCQRSFTEHTWNAVAQVRQDVPHKKTFFFLEQLILKHSAHTEATTVTTVPQGLDFFYGDKSNCAKFVDFLASCVPIRYRTAKKLVSADLKSMVYNYKHTYAVEIAPICRDDLVLLPPRTASSLGSINPLCLVYRVSNLIFVVDPTTLQTAELGADRYWRDPFRPQLSAPHLIRFTVLDVVPAAVEATGEAAAVFAHGTSSTKKHRGRKGGRRGRKGRRRAADGDDSDDDDGSVAGSSVAGGASGKPRIFGGSVASIGGRSGRSRGTGLGGALNPAGRRKLLADDDDAGSMVTSAKDTTRSVGVGQGGMGGVTMGRRLFTSGTSVTTSVTGGPKGKFLLADVELIRERDLGVSDNRVTVRTHLGNVLKPGDTVLGYDMAGALFVREAVNKGTSVEGTGDGAGESTGRKGGRKGGRAGAGPKTRAYKGTIPEVIVVRKIFPERSRKTRGWKLRKLNIAASTEGLPAGSRAAAEAERSARDYEAFLDDLEQDREMRRQVRRYKQAPKGPAVLAAEAKAKAAAAAAAMEAGVVDDAGSGAAAAASGAGADDEKDELAELEALVSKDAAADAEDDEDDDDDLLDEDEAEQADAVLAKRRAERLAAQMLAMAEDDAAADDAAAAAAAGAGEDEDEESEWVAGDAGRSAEFGTVREAADEDEDEDEGEEEGEGDEA
ncbi:hypothetical protein FNF29_00086 [Cafeteria roenbergensis]|uniref:60S ribosomal export protein NMD3 n=1 Tax=Cafeteria roenbergensis TaxID=33653 RepID=A0A5A8CZD2_CAFRO|nr:hypothetical protein FNF29_00086 [Cafeteria roenbergensis]|eukprot:KAA0157510.1 hypothetical protein FNF29_00086 [Cafeteria roenbergensis]